MLVFRLDFLESNNIIIGIKSTAHYGNDLVASSLKCVYSNRSKCLPYAKTIYAKWKRIRSTLTSLLKLLWCRMSKGLSFFMTLTWWISDSLAASGGKPLSNRHVWISNWLLMWIRHSLNCSISLNPTYIQKLSMPFWKIWFDQRSSQCSKKQCHL